MGDRSFVYDLVSRELARMSDDDLTRLLVDSPVLGSGIGGVRQKVVVADMPVFVKKIPLAPRERSGDGFRSTANMFDMPLMCQYGVGAPGFGAWREVAANEMATSWILDGEANAHPMMFHWRVLDEQRPLGSPCQELDDIEALVAYWHGSEAVRERAQGIVASTASVVAFLEYLPTTLPDWLGQQFAVGVEAGDTAIEMVDAGLRSAVIQMNGRGLFHFDAHLDNILCDGQRIYVADFGLATSPAFELSEQERDFIEANRSHDVAHTTTRLVDWIVSEFVTGSDFIARNDFVQACALGRADMTGLPPTSRALVTRFAELAALVNEFYRRLHVDDRSSTYPTESIERACRDAGLPVPEVKRSF